MAKKKSQQPDNLQELESALTKTEHFIEENQKPITYIVGGIILIVAAWLGFSKFYMQPRQDEALAQMFMAENYFEKDMKSAFFSTVHEAGHAMYEQGLPVDHFGTPFGQAASYGIHESQSRMWENMIGRSLPFWNFFYPRLKDFFPVLKKTDVDDFYRMINTVEPSLIRVEADEVTYSLHIMLRFEIEKMLINDDLKISELPDMWNEKMKEYLGIVPRDYKMGVMQDVHWSMGAIGYFPSYALGNLYAAQFLKQAEKDHPDIWNTVRAGEFTVLLNWLRKNIHSLGRRLDPLDLVQSVTREKLSPKPFIQYLNDKYNKIYNI